MKRILLLIILLISGVSYSINGICNEQIFYDIKHSDDSSQSNGSVKAADYKLLFVGNSLTYTNDLPKLVRSKARDKGIVIETTTLAYGNYAIVDHWADGNVQTLIKSKQYDYVIIQQGPSSQADGFEMLINGGKLYSDLCKANGAKLVYFMVWPSRRYYYTFDGVIANYTAGAEANDAILSPVGKVWKEYFDNTGDFSYYGSDQFHPSLKGSLVAADVILDSLLKEESQENENKQAWLVGVGHIENNTINVQNMYMTENGAFGDNFNPDEITRVPWGELNIEFTGCHVANLKYSSNLSVNFNAFGSGGYPVQRLAMNESSAMCDDEVFSNNNNKSFFSGTFFGGMERNGEGLTIDYLDKYKVIITWFTYIPVNNIQVQ